MNCARRKNELALEKYTITEVFDPRGLSKSEISRVDTSAVLDAGSEGRRPLA